MAVILERDPVKHVTYADYLEDFYREIDRRYEEREANRPPSYMEKLEAKMDAQESEIAEYDPALRREDKLKLWYANFKVEGFASVWNEKDGWLKPATSSQIVRAVDDTV